MLFRLVFAASVWTSLVYSLLRFVYLLWNYKTYTAHRFTELLQAFFYGVRFDLAGVSALSFILLLIAAGADLLLRNKQPGSKLRTAFFWIFLLVHLPFITLNFIDTELVNFVGRRFTADVFSQLFEVPGKTTSYVLYAWPLSLMAALVTVLFVYVLRGLFCRWSLQVGPYGYSRQWIAVIGGIVLAFVGVRGGLQSKPIGFAHAQIFTVPAMNTLTMNTTFTFLQTLVREKLPREQFFQDSKEMLRYLNGAITGPSWMESRRFKKPQNVVLIVVESLSNEYTNSEFTPFLNQLGKKSAVFSNAFANARRSIEGIGAIFGGIPALMDQPFISSQYMSNYFQGLGSRLEKNNYHTSFFHGAKNGSMYFDQFMHAAGVREYFGQNEFPNPEQTDGSWGIWDEPMLLWSLQKMQQFPKPFFSGIFTLSSHHPFKVPEQYQNQFPKGPVPILQSIAYTDFALSKFFAEAEKQNWYQDTLFIITADHTSQIWHKEFDNEIGKYHVPLVLFHPKLDFKGLDTSQVVSHIDILPTIMDFLGLQSDDVNYLSRSVFVPGDRVAVSFIDGRYYLITKDYFLRYSRGADFLMYARNDQNERKALQEPAFAAQKQHLENQLKANIQYFSQGLWDNKLYYPAGAIGK